MPTSTHWAVRIRRRVPHFCGCTPRGKMWASSPTANIDKSVFSVVQRAPKLLCGFENMRIFSLLVDADELAVLHKDLAVRNRRAAELAGHAEQDVTVDVFIRERSEGLVVHDDHVGGKRGKCVGKTGDEGAGKSYFIRFFKRSER